MGYIPFQNNVIIYVYIHQIILQHINHLVLVTGLSTAHSFHPVSAQFKPNPNKDNYDLSPRMQDLIQQLLICMYGLQVTLCDGDGG